MDNFLFRQMKVMAIFSITLPLILSNKQTQRTSYCDLRKIFKKKRKKKTKAEATLPQVLLLQSPKMPHEWGQNNKTPNHNLIYITEIKF